MLFELREHDFLEHSNIVVLKRKLCHCHVDDRIHMHFHTIRPTLSTTVDTHKRSRNPSDTARRTFGKQAESLPSTFDGDWLKWADEHSRSERTQDHRENGERMGTSVGSGGHCVKSTNRNRCGGFGNVQSTSETESEVLAALKDRELIRKNM